MKNRTIIALYSIPYAILNIIFILAAKEILFSYKNFFSNFSLYMMLCSMILLIIVYIYWLKPYKISKSDLKNKNIYRCISKKELKNIIVEHNKVYIKRKKHKNNFDYNFIKLPFIYFHSDLKKNSFMYNHSILKFPEYILIIPVSNLMDEIYTRNIDKAILYTSDYLGTAKIIKTDKLQFSKLVGIKYISTYLKNVLLLYCIGIFFISLLYFIFFSKL